MTQSVSNEHALKHAAAQAVNVAIDNVVQAASEQANTEQATGILMLAYDLDADNAFELLKWGSQARGRDIGPFTRQLVEDRAAGCEPAELRAVCDEVLFDLPSDRGA